MAIINDKIMNMCSKKYDKFNYEIAEIFDAIQIEANDDIPVGFKVIMLAVDSVVDSTLKEMDNEGNNLNALLSKYIIENKKEIFKSVCLLAIQLINGRITRNVRNISMNHGLVN